MPRLVNRVLDVAVRQGQRGITLPLIPGVDPSGVVSAIGDDVAHVAPAGRVTELSHAVPSGAGLDSEAVRNGSGRVEMVRSTVRLRAPIERILPLGQAAEAHRLVETSSGSGKIILDPTLG